jgi:cell division inhibitor SepF
VSEPEPEPAVEEPPLSRGGRWRPRATTREGVDVLPSAHRLTTGIHYPRSFEDAQSLADLFKAGSLLVCDLQAVNEKDRPRLVNFLYGVTYGCDGKSERINEFTFLFAPRLFEVVADRQHGGDRLAGDVPRYSLPE